MRCSCFLFRTSISYVADSSSRNFSPSLCVNSVTEEFICHAKVHINIVLGIHFSAKTMCSAGWPEQSVQQSRSQRRGPRADFLKIISVGIPTYAGVKTGL